MLLRVRQADGVGLDGAASVVIAQVFRLKCACFIFNATKLTIDSFTFSGKRIPKKLAVTEFAHRLNSVSAAILLSDENVLGQIWSS